MTKTRRPRLYDVCLLSYTILPPSNQLLNTSLHRKPSYFDEIGFDYIENSKDTFVRHVPPSSQASQHLDALLMSLDAAADEDGGD
jgi:hypothetical protein